MADTRTERLSRQLKAQADSILNKTGFDLALDLLKTCDVLLRMTGESADPGQLDQLDQDLLMDGYRSIAGYISAYTKQSGLYFDQGDDLVQGSEEMLEALIKKRAAFAHIAQERQKSIDGVKKDINTLKQTTENLDKKAQELAVIRDGLKDSLKQYPRELFDKIEKENKELNDEVNKKREQYEEENKKRLKLENELTMVQENIDAMPDNLKELHTKMENLNNELEQIRHADETCNDEKQAEVQAEIEKMKGQLTEDENTYTELNKLLGELRQSAIQYDSKAQTLETEAIDLINKTIRTMRPKLEEHQRKLKQVSDDNAQIEKSYSECNAMRKQYEAWFNNDQTPLQKLMEALKSEGNLNLKGALDLQNCEKINSAIGRIRMDLHYLDEILKKAAQAYGMDIQKLRQRAQGKMPR